MGNRASECEWSWDVDGDRRVTSLKMSGVVSATDILAAQRDVAGHHRFNPSFPLIVDLTMTSDLPVGWDEMGQVVRRSPIAVWSPRAIVATTVITAAIAHAYRALRTTITATDVVHVCRSVDEARQWIGAQSQWI